jgi:hypothetical protein
MENDVVPKFAQFRQIDADGYVGGALHHASHLLLKPS